MPQSWDMGQILLLPLRRKAYWGFSGHPKNPTGLNPRTRVPVASTLTTRPPKPSELKERRGYSHLKEEVLDRTMWRARFGRGFGPVVRQTAEWMNKRTNCLSNLDFKNAICKFSVFIPPLGRVATLQSANRLQSLNLANSTVILC